MEFVTNFDVGRVVPLNFDLLPENWIVRNGDFLVLFFGAEGLDTRPQFSSDINPDVPSGRHQSVESSRYVSWGVVR